jgi:hypothetical protein
VLQKGSNKWKKYRTEPKLVMQLVRAISINMTEYRLVVDQLTLDFEKGVPYIFLIMKKKGSNKALDYFIKRFTFSYDPVEGNPLKMKIHRTDGSELPPVKESWEGTLQSGIFDFHNNIERIDEMMEQRKKKDAAASAGPAGQKRKI